MEELNCLLVLDTLHNEEYYISIIEMKLIPSRFTIIRNKRHKFDPVIKTEPAIFEYIKTMPHPKPNPKEYQWPYGYVTYESWRGGF